MTYKGHIENGTIVLDEPVDLADGTPVRVEIAVLIETTKGTPLKSGRSLAERYASVIGTAEGLPEDAAKNIDHYLYGTPKIF